MNNSVFYRDEEKIKKIKITYYINFIIYLLIINSSFYIGFFIFKKEKPDENFSPYSPQITKIKIRSGESAKIGIISDFQLDSNRRKKKDEKIYEDNVRKALQVLKKNNIDIIIIAGDITNKGRHLDYILFNNIFNSVFTNSNETPIVISLMGNHDYIDNKYEPLLAQQKFFNYTKSYPYSHYIINDYNFIFWSSDNKDIKENAISDYNWIKSTLEKARNTKKRKGDPIFVITHIHPKNTVYGSDKKWGHQGIFEILKKYPEVISISGHSHYSLRNIGSIWQGNFTAINTQSLSYVDLDTDFLNFREVRLDSAKNDSMGLIAYLNRENVIFERIEFSTEEILEEKWKIDFPINISNFVYTLEKMNKKVKPYFKDKGEIKIEIIKEKRFLIIQKHNYFVFNAAIHPDYVYMYRIIFINKNDGKKKIYKYYSDYFKNEKLRKDIIKYKLPKDLTKGKYSVEIYAIDSFDNISKPLIGVVNI